MNIIIKTTASLFLTLALGFDHLSAAAGDGMIVAGRVGMEIIQSEDGQLVRLSNGTMVPLTPDLQAQMAMFVLLDERNQERHSELVDNHGGVMGALAAGEISARDAARALAKQLEEQTKSAEERDAAAIARDAAAARRGELQAAALADLRLEMIATKALQEDHDLLVEYTKAQESGLAGIVVGGGVYLVGAAGLFPAVAVGGVVYIAWYGAENASSRISAFAPQGFRNVMSYCSPGWLTSKLCCKRARVNSKDK